MCKANTIGTIIVMRGDGGSSNRIKSLAAMTPCSHEEADNRIFVHDKDATSQGSKSIIIKANNTDVVVIALSTTSSLQELGLESLWIALLNIILRLMILTHHTVLKLILFVILTILIFFFYNSCSCFMADQLMTVS